METLKGLKRTHYCGDLRMDNVGEEVILNGWVQKKRNLGGLVFVDLRDIRGISQIIFDADVSKDAFEKAEKLGSEYVVAVKGIVRERQSKNPNMPTGDIEIEATELRVLSKSETPPIYIKDNDNVSEDLRLKYRFLDLRKPSMQNNLVLRSKVANIVRNYLSGNNFVEIETPFLIKPSPEGARDYLVPSRVNPGKFYALPQSPQIYKQLLMIGGMEKYFQIARCFRDEDLRADRQPEFTQIDIEMSFAEEEDIWNTVENLMKKIFKEVKNVELNDFVRLTYNECMDRFGSDKPDTRFGMEIQNITDIFKETTFEIFSNIIKDGGIINAIVLKNEAGNVSRKKVDKYTELVKVYKAKALSYLKYNDNELTGSIVKVLTDENKEEIIKKLNLTDNDMVFIIADEKEVVKTALGALRVRLGNDFNLINRDLYNFLWVTEFPMFEYSKEENRYVAAHHPFTSPRKQDMDKLLTDKANCYSRAYDLVLNGYELLSGSIRIHDQKLQEKVFEAIDMTPSEAREKFGFFLDAFKYGAPPHCGVGIGLERLIMILADTDNIRDVVAFPKTASASCLMTEAPGRVTEKQLDELGIKIK